MTTTLPPDTGFMLRFHDPGLLGSETRYLDLRVNPRYTPDIQVLLRNEVAPQVSVMGHSVFQHHRGGPMPVGGAPLDDIYASIATLLDDGNLVRNAGGRVPAGAGVDLSVYLARGHRVGMHLDRALAPAALLDAMDAARVLSRTLPKM